MGAWETCNMLIDATERCRTMPNRRELIYSPTYHRSRELFSGRKPEGVAINQAQRTWVFPNGSTLQFAHHDGGAERFRGLEFTAIDYDPDDTYYDPRVVDILKSRVRS